MERLEDFLEHDDPIVRNAAQQLTVLKNGLYNEDLSKEQFDELVNDLFEVEEVKEMADDLNRKIMILKAFSALKTIAGILSVGALSI